MTDKQFVAHCVWCGKALHDAPTLRWWIRHTEHGKGICHRCILRLAYGVLRGAEMDCEEHEDDPD